jgi:hypothetical protein
MTTIQNTGVLGILINYAPNFGTQSGLTLTGGAGLGPVGGLVFNNGTNFGLQTGLMVL